jgi:hypothetical protein
MLESSKVAASNKQRGPNGNARKDLKPPFYFEISIRVSVIVSTSPDSTIA